MRNRSDQLGKNILRELLAMRGDARTEEEVPPGDALRIDLWFVPDESRRDVQMSLSGILAKISEAPAVIELWSDTVDVAEFHACMRKLYAWHHTLELRDKRKWSLPPLWLVCAGRPEAVFVEISFESVAKGPPGLYRLSGRGISVFVVVIPELARVRETLLLRLLGRSPVRRLALDDLKELPTDAIEHTVADQWLIRLKFDLQASDQATLSREEGEFVMDMRAWLEERDRQLVQSEVQSAVAKTRRETRRETSLGLLRKLVETRLGRELMTGEQRTLAKHVRAEGAERVTVTAAQLSPVELAAWVAPKTSR